LLIPLILLSCGGSNNDDGDTSDKDISYIQISPNFINLRINDEKKIEIQEVFKDNSHKQIDNSKLTFELENSDIASIDSLGNIKGLTVGNTTISIKYSNLNPIHVKVVVSNELNTSNINKAYFGNLYLDTIPKDSSLEQYDERLFSMITGKVFDEQGKPLKDVIVSIHKFNEFGTTKTDENGTYAIPAEGAKTLIVRYVKPGFTTIDRDVYAKIQDWTIVPDVTMLTKDTKVSTIKMSDSNPRIHTSSKVTDERGERQATIVFEGINRAKAVDKDGNERELGTINIRATEFKTPPSMPSNLPEETAYTYCVDITVDGIRDDESVVFDEPIAMYVDNFLGFNVGEIVPVGYYDKNLGEWVGSDNGIVVRLLDTNGNGKIDALDADGDGQPDDLNGNADFSDEVIGIQDNLEYQVGKTYWRAVITHFTPWDLNWGIAPPLNAESPGNPSVESGNPPSGCNVNTNSYITSKTQVLHEDIGVTGTDIKLHYSSKAANGHKHIISAAVDTTNMPSSAFEADVILQIAGKRYEKTLNRGEINQVEFEWDGKDAIGNQLSGIIDGTFTVRYKYTMLYYGISKDYDIAWAQIGTNPTGIPGIDNIAYQSIQDITIDTRDASSSIDYANSIANGWSIEDDLYMNLHMKGTLSNAKTQKYIEVKNGILFAVDEEPENRFTVPVYYALFPIFPVENLGHGSNILSLVNFHIVNKTMYEIEKIPLGRFSEFNFVKNYEDPPKIGYDNYAYYRGTAFEGAIQLYLGASFSSLELKQKLRNMIDNNESFVFPTNDGNGNLNLYGNYWVFLKPTEYLYQKVSNIVGHNYDKSFYDDFDLALTKNDIVIFNDNLGYVYDTTTGTLSKIFDNTQKRIIRTYEHDSNNRLILIQDQFNNKIKISRDYNGNPVSITAPNGQITRLQVNYKGDLSEISYEDNSAYMFDYNEGSLLTSKRTPLGYYSSYFYDDKGRVERQIDTNDGEWRFFKTKRDKATEYNVVKPEGDKITYIDTKDNDKALSSLIKFPSGYSYNTLTSSDKTVSNTLKNNVQTRVESAKDPITLNTILKSQAITMPSGLTKTVTNSVSYAGDIKNPQAKIQTITINSKTTTLTDNYQEGTLTLISPNNIKEVLTYDKTTSLLTSYRHSNLEPINYEYDNKGRVTKQSQTTNVISYMYDQRGNIQTVKDAKGQITSYEYDSMDRPLSITYPNNIKEHYSYDKEGNILRYITPNDTNFHFTYNSLKQRLSLSSPLNKQTLYYYNKNRDITSIITPSGKEVKYNYDNSLLKSIKTSDNDIYNYTYSFQDKIESITRDNNQKTSYMYDGELLTRISYEGALNQDISFAYNNDFLPTSITYSNKQDIYSYNNDNQLMKAGNFNIERNSINSLITKISDNKYEKAYSYDTQGYISNIKDNYYEENILSRYENTNIKTIQERTNDKVLTYEYMYDTLNRLIRVTKNNQITEEYSYDNQGNRLSSTINGQTTTASYNSEDQLLTYGDNIYSYDNDGRLMKYQNDKGVTSYKYDAFGNLKEVILPNSDKITYMYNANNQRVTKLINNQIEEKYLWLDRITLLAVYDKDNNIKYRFTYTNERTPISYTDKESNVYYLSYNHQGSLKAITNQNNQIVKSIDYDSFGNIVEEVYYDEGGNIIQETKYDSNGNVITGNQNINANSYNANINSYNGNYNTNENTVSGNANAQSASYSANSNQDTNSNIVQRNVAANQNKNANSYNANDITSNYNANINSYNSNIATNSNPSANSISANPTLDIPFGFAGGLYDQDTKLIKFGYREYDSNTGRWTSKDPIDFGGGSSNLYGYVVNDPVNLVDPTGEFVPIAIIGKALFGATIGAIVEIGVQALNNYLNDCDVFDGNNYNWGDVAISAGIGAIGPGFVSSIQKIKYSAGAIKTLGGQATNTVNRANKIKDRIGNHWGVIGTQVGWQAGKYASKEGLQENNKCSCKK
jgi:RHS repeat-associated protein